MPPESILHAEGSALVERGDVTLEALVDVVAVDAREPAGAELVLERAAGELEPPRVEEVVVRIRARHPDHDGGRIGHHSEAVFLLAMIGLRAMGGERISEDLREQLKLLHEFG